MTKAIIYIAYIIFVDAAVAVQSAYYGYTNPE
jgi:hypothetical protein